MPQRWSLAAMGAGSVALNAFPTSDDSNDGSFVSGAASITPLPPTNLVANDILLCFVQSSNQAISAPTNSGAGTWAEVTNSPQGIGTAASAGSVRLAVFWMRYTGVSIGTVTVADSGDHTVAGIQAYRGCITSGNPWNATSGQTETGTTTTATFPSLTTTVGNCLIVGAVANAVDSLIQQFSNVSAPGNLTPDVGFSGAATTFAESVDNAASNSIVGTGGGVDYFAGRLAAAGSAGTVQATMTASSANYAEMLIALTSN